MGDMIGIISNKRMGDMAGMGIIKCLIYQPSKLDQLSDNLQWNDWIKYLDFL